MNEGKSFKPFLTCTTPTSARYWVRRVLRVQWCVKYRYSFVLGICWKRLGLEAKQLMFSTYLKKRDPMNCSSPRLLCLWNSPDMNTGMGIPLLQGIFLTQRSNPGLFHCRQILYYLSHEGSPHMVKLSCLIFSYTNWAAFYSACSTKKHLLLETLSNHILRKGPQRCSLRKTSHRTWEHPKAVPTQELPTGRFSHRRSVSCSS